MKIVWGMLDSLQEYKNLAEKFNKELKDFTNGQFEIEVKLFEKDPENPLKEIEEGRLDIYQVPTTQLKGLTGKEHDWLGVWEVPFLFRDEVHVEKYIKSLEGKEKLKTLETEALLPLTYSYAGGFCAVLNRKGHLPITDFSKLNTIDFAKFEYEDMTLDAFLHDIYPHLPSNILMYEINEMLKLKPEIKRILDLEISKHLVVARISMISKAMLEKLGNFKETFLLKLEAGLDEERQVIYDRAEKNIEALKADEVLGMNSARTEVLNQEIEKIKRI